MRFWFSPLPLLLLGAAASSGMALARPPPAARVLVQAGDIFYRGADGTSRRLTSDGGNDEPVLSPDGRTVAYVHLDAPSHAEGTAGPTSLWLADVAAGRRRRLLASRVDDAPQQNLASFGHPVFSLDGGFVYVEADAWATSPAVHQVSVATGQERFVIDGAVMGVLRSGPYRGYLLVQRHMYYDRPDGGSYNPVYVVRPDARQEFLVPGSDRDDGETSVAPWLARKGWTAW